MIKLDLKKEFRELFNPPTKDAVLVSVPELNYLKTDGFGDPNDSESFQSAIEALYSVAYTLKFMLKRDEKGTFDYVVPPLEGLWWCDDMRMFSQEDKTNWKWTLMIMQPAFITLADVERAAAIALAKKSNEVISQVRFEKYNEGKCAQIMHIGPYSEEKSNIEKLHNFIRENGFSLEGLHHEIYLSDPRKSKPEKMKTIIRQPYKA